MIRQPGAAPVRPLRRMTDGRRPPKNGRFQESQIISQNHRRRVEVRLSETYLDTGLRFGEAIDEFREIVMLLGYARVSTDQQDHALQLDALRAAGCDKVFVETGSGTRADRPELAKVLEQVRQDDVLVVWRLDRLARSLRHLIDIADDLNRRGVALKSITENIDTTTPSGRFMFNILGALSSMEREIIVERTRAGRRCRPWSPRWSSCRARRIQDQGCKGDARIWQYVSD